MWILRPDERFAVAGALLNMHVATSVPSTSSSVAVTAIPRPVSLHVCHRRLLLVVLQQSRQRHQASVVSSLLAMTLAPCTLTLVVTMKSPTPLHLP